MLPNLVRHYKGGLYLVLSGDARLEPEGLEGEAQVVYQSLEDGRVWIRSKSDFTSHVQVNGVMEPRFKRVIAVKE